MAFFFLPILGIGRDSQYSVHYFTFSQDLDGSGRIRYTEFLAATIEAQGAISEERLAEAFDRFDTDDSGYISVDNLKDVLGKDFPRQEIIDILGDAADPSGDGYGDNATKISYSAFLRLWEKNNEKKIRANTLRMVGSQVNLASSYEDDDDSTNDGLLNSSFYSTDDCQEAARGRATFLMDKHGTKKVDAGDTICENTAINIPTMGYLSAGPPKIIHEYVGGDEDFSMGGGIQI